MNDSYRSYEDYAAFVESLKKPGQAIIDSLDPKKADLLHMSVLLADECGELVGALKKHCIYGKELDFANVIEELGDIEFALSGIRTSLGIDRDRVLADNVFKLNKRYSSGSYSDEQAKARADKV